MPNILIVFCFFLVRAPPPPTLVSAVTCECEVRTFLFTVSSCIPLTHRTALLLTFQTQSNLQTTQQWTVWSQMTSWPTGRNSTIRQDGASTVTLNMNKYKTDRNSLRHQQRICRPLQDPRIHLVWNTALIKKPQRDSASSEFFRKPTCVLTC